jgi:uncharacterized protein (DUF111 family)
MFELGVYEFYFTQIIMKKGRPGLLLTVICNKSNLKLISDFILNFSTTIGLRYYHTDRIELGRRIEKVETEYGTFRVKISKTKDGSERIKPESEDVINYSLQNGQDPYSISRKIIEAYKKKQS